MTVFFCISLLHTTHKADKNANIQPRGGGPSLPASTPPSHGLLARLLLQRLLVASNIPKTRSVRPIYQQKGGQAPQDQRAIEPPKRAVPVLPAETREDHGTGRAQEPGEPGVQKYEQFDPRVSRDSGRKPTTACTTLHGCYRDIAAGKGRRYSTAADRRPRPRSKPASGRFPQQGPDDR